MLHSVDFSKWKTTPWCGPTALSFLTGVPLVHSHSRLAWMKDLPLTKVEGARVSEFILMLREQGYFAKQIDVLKGGNHYPAIKRFMQERTPYEKAMPVLIVLRNHYVSAHFDYLADNWTKKPTLVHDFPMLGRVVESAFVVSKK